MAKMWAHRTVEEQPRDGDGLVQTLTLKSVPNESAGPLVLLFVEDDISRVISIVVCGGRHKGRFRTLHSRVVIQAR